MFHIIQFFLEVCVFIIFRCSFVNSQLYNQNGTSIQPYPYQITLGLPPGQGLGSQNVGIQPVGSFPYPYHYPGNNLPTGQIFNGTQNSNNYYAMLAQQGRPAYQYPQNYPQPNIGYAQPGMGYPPPWGANLPQGYGYPYQQPLERFGNAYPRMGYPYQDVYPRLGQGTGQQQLYGGMPDPYTNVNSEIIDVSPDYHRKAMGWTSANTLEGTRSSNSGDNVEGSNNQGSQNVKPKYHVKIDSTTSNFTSIPSNLTKPIITTKKFTTSIRRTFVYDSTKPGGTKAINLHLINGVEVTTSPPPTTTENEQVEGSTGVTPKGRRWMDVPKSCPKGTLVAHNGKCIAPFSVAKLDLGKSVAVENTTRAPAQDENAIEE